MNDLKLTKQDVSSLAQEKSVETKKSTIKKIAHYYNAQGELSAQGRQLAEDIFRIMIHDIELKVREATAESLKNSRNLPHDIIADIIADTETVSVPFIKFYNALANEDLIKIIESQNEPKQKAVASRHNLPEEISHIISEKCSEDVVGTLISNDTALIADKTYDNIVNKYKDSENIKERLVYRSQLPVHIISKIMDSLSDELKKRLVMVHDLPEDIASDLVEKVKEKSTLRISEEFSSDKQIEDFYTGQLAVKEDDFEKYKMSITNEIEKIWMEIYNIKEKNDALIEKTKDGCTIKDIEDNNNFVFQKMDEHLDELNKKFVLKNENSTALKNLEDQFKRIILLLATKVDHENDNWLIAKKPING